jgi:hypothetical protein
MNFTQIQERLRSELLRRVQRGTLSVSLLSRQTGFGKSHVSNFLHAKGRLSLEALDRVLEAQHLSVEDLIELGARAMPARDAGEPVAVKLLTHHASAFDPLIRPGAVEMMLQLPKGSLELAGSKPVPSRRSWERFVAIRIGWRDAGPMEPLIYPSAIAVVDRHYNSLAPFRPPRPNLYAVRYGERVLLRYAEYGEMRLAFRALDIFTPLELIEIEPDRSPGEFIAGRVVLILNEV